MIDCPVDTNLQLSFKNQETHIFYYHLEPNLQYLNTL
jgi:hypothetical protein